VLLVSERIKLAPGRRGGGVKRSVPLEKGKIFFEEKRTI